MEAPTAIWATLDLLSVLLLSVLNIAMVSQLMVSQLRTSPTAGAPSLGSLLDAPLPELLHGDGYRVFTLTAANSMHFHAQP
jgi:hypothetical protein